MLLETFGDAEIAAMGISKRAHIKKLKDGIKKLAELLFQGRQPEGMQPGHSGLLLLPRLIFNA